MGHPHIALIGHARSGKDTIAARLVTRFSYTRIAFADPLKELTLNANPIVAYEPSGYGPLPTRLSDVVRRVGWERAKDEITEVRRTLQRVGHAVREQEPDYWLSIAMDKIAAADAWNLPVVATDCRYRNEAHALKVRGFKLVRVVRPSGGMCADMHESERELDGYPADASIANTGTVDDLNALADALT
ncbi:MULTISPECIES: hypothetical protein [Streptomyces]|uniref:deoxynucleotide monophosphate kinase family protein n=1 Tax=Streptomyces TaxID=1883 RepID=UPI000B9DD792|nr:hypothetical protein [Streptomyces kasugaensis]